MTIKEATLESLLTAMLGRTTETSAEKVSLGGIVVPYLSEMKFVEVPKGSSISIDSAKSTAESLAEAAELMLTASEKISERVNESLKQEEDSASSEPRLVSKKSFGNEELGFVTISKYDDDTVEMDWEGINVPLYDLPESLLKAVKNYSESL